MGALLDALNQDGQAVALRYVRAGYPVFPCNPLNKRPLTEHGHKEATTELLKIRGWWAKWPLAMIGVPMGAKTGLWVLDIDQNPSREKYGLQSLADIGHDLAELMDTAVARTAGGGYHIYFRFDPDHPVTNARGALPKFVDVRGEGGYVVMAGSRNSEGGTYEWVNDIADTEVETAPEWLLQLLGGSSAPLDFNSASRPIDPSERVASIGPGTWHENTRDLIARMVKEGVSDATVAAIAPRFTEPGYSDDQTVREFLTHARTAREKWGYQPRDLEAEQAAKTDDLYKVLSIDDLAALEPPEWRVDGIFTTYGSSTIYGAYESYKTFVALDLLLSLAAGHEWHGRATKPCGVLYIAGEGQFGVAQRIVGWCHARNGGARPNLFKVLPEAVAIPSPGNLDKLRRTIDALPFIPAVIALDTITRMSGGGSLNDEKDMQQYVLGMDRLRHHTAGHIMNIGHTGKDKEKGLLGSVVLPAAMETIICVERNGDSLKLVNTNPKGKQKDGPNFADIPLRAQKVEFEQAGKASSTLVLMPDETVVDAERAQYLGPLQTKIMSALEQAARDGQTLGFTRLKTMTGCDDSGNLGGALRKMARRGLIENIGDEGNQQWKLL